MSETERACEVLVIGAGPAGATAARLLARNGREVLLLQRDERPAAHAEETLVPSAAPALARLGLLALFEERRWIGSARHGAIWGADRIHWRAGAERERGFQVPRPEFDAALRELARGAGAELLAVEHVSPIRDPGRIELRTAAGGMTVRPRVCLIASGRQATDALLPDSRFAETLPSSLALSTQVPEGGEFQDATLVEAVACGWWWWLAQRGGRGGFLTLFADRDLVKQRGAAEVWNAASSQALGPARRAGPAPQAGAQACCRLRSSSLSLYCCGDAAGALDPLSSQGIEKALVSGEHAAACVESQLAGAFEPARILEHQRSWERGLYLAHRRSTLEFYAREPRFAEEPFWRARRAPALARPVLSGSLVLAVRASRGQALVESQGRLRERAAWTSGESVRPASEALDLVFERCARALPLLELERGLAREPAFAGWTPRSLRAALAELYAEGWLVEASVAS